MGLERKGQAPQGGRLPSPQSTEAVGGQLCGSRGGHTDSDHPTGGSLRQQTMEARGWVAHPGSHPCLGPQPPVHTGGGAPVLTCLSGKRCQECGPEVTSDLREQGGLEVQKDPMEEFWKETQCDRRDSLWDQRSRLRWGSMEGHRQTLERERNPLALTATPQNFPAYTTVSVSQARPHFTHTFDL